MSRSEWITTLALLVLAVAAGASVLLSYDGPLRHLFGLWLVLMAPGWALLRLLRLPMSLATLIAASFGISTAVGIVISLLLFYGGLWSVELAASVLTVLVVCAVVGDAWLRNRSSPAQADSRRPGATE